MTDLSQRIASLPPERLAVLFERLGNRRGVEQGIPRRPPTERCELSFAQERFWFLDQLYPGSGANNTFRAVRLTGWLEIPALAKALAEVAVRHEVLRASFQEENGKLFQVFGRGPLPRLAVISLEALAPELCAPAVRSLAVDAAQLSFDLARGPLLRVWLLRLEEREHVLLLTQHHIVSDGWSSGILLRDLAAFYTAELAADASSLPVLSVQYADFAAWQRCQLAGERLASLLSYWRERLTDLPILELPTDRPRPSVQSFRGASVPLALRGGLTERLEALSRRAGATLFASLAALVKLQLMRYSGQRDLALGTPVAGRNQVELEDLIGCFINTLVLRLKGGEEGSFLSLLAAVRDTVVGALAHQDLPFAKLVEDLTPERSLQQTPLFQVMVVLQNAPVGEPGLPGLALEPYPVDGGVVGLDLQFDFTAASGGIAGRVEFRADLFDRATVGRWAAHFENLVEAVVSAPGRPVADLPLLPATERMQVVLEWNDTARSYGRYRPLHLDLADRAEESPERVALVFAEEHLSYGELDRRSARLASRLRSLGVGPEERVAVKLERSLDLPLATVAVLRAGGAYVPLDPSYPEERLAFMLRDAGAPVLLTHRRWGGGGEPGATAVLCLDGEVPAPTDPRGPDLAAAAMTAASLAYVIYTSGSTGQPKGAMNTHGAVRNRLLWMQEAYGLDATDRVLQKTPFSFDVSVWELFWPLVTGACLVLAKPGGHQDPAYLSDLVQREGVTTMHFVPSMLEAFLEAPAVERCTSLRRVICSGEALPQDLADRFQARIRAELHNLYGPTEAAVDVAAAPCGRGGQSATVSIGRPIGNLAIHLLDRVLDAVPIGMPGELYIGGIGVGRGYLGRAELTAERFVPDGCGAEAGARLYRTGDLARFLPDGRIQFLGRIDQQVKLRGFRIELGEIEAVLRESPVVAEAVVVGRRAARGDLRLIAYLVCRGDAMPSAEDLRALLRRKLPSYMVPAAFVRLDRLPLNPSGKLDQRALPNPEPAPAPGGPSAVVRTPTEEILAGFWMEILGLPRVGAEDDFFALGGHSLLASQVVARIRHAYRVEVPLLRIFESPTLGSLAAVVDELCRQGEHLPLVPALEPTARTGPLPVSFAQQRFWFVQQMDPASGIYNLPLAISLDGEVEVGLLRRGLAELVRRHEVLRTTIRAFDGEPRQVILPAAPVPLPVVDLSPLAGSPRLQSATARRLARDEARRPFDLAEDIPLRACLLRLDPGRHWALVTVHHAATDGWSMDLLFQELGIICSAFLRGRPSPLPELPIQYADYAAWQRRWLTGEVLETEIAFWRRQLAAMPPTLDLPTDRPRQAAPTFRGGRCPFTLQAPLARAAAALAQREGATPFMVLLSAFVVLLARASAQADVSVGTLVAGRTLPGTEHLIGALLNSLVLRTHLDGEPTCRALLLRVREVCLNAYTHQHLPFERLVEELQPERDLSQSPLFQVVVQLQNHRSREVTLPGLQFSVAPIERPLSVFDLTLALEQDGESIGGALEYSSDLFDRTTTQRMVGHFAALLAGLVERGEERALGLPLLTPAERQQVFREWNPIALRRPQGSFLDLFAVQVEVRPDAIALAGGGEQLSYAALDGLSDRLGAALAERGVGAETVVGLWMERSAGMMAALLGVLKAGGAFLPLDPSYPRSRLTYLLQHSMSRLLLARELPQELPLAGVEVMDPLRMMPDEPVPGRRRAILEAAAYVLYTSGSTGEPKGVVVPHGALETYTQEMVERLRLVADDRVLQFASPSFDVLIEELFPAWAAGACVVLVRPEVLPSPRELARGLEREQVTVAELPTAYWHEWTRDLLARGEAPPPALRNLLIGGEQALQEMLAAWLRFGCRLTNAYGLTEAAVTSCLAESDKMSPLPIGRPIGNTRLHVLDAWGQMAPVGVPGELYIGGEGMARGYLGRPDLTAARFLPDPFGEEPGACLYRSGDLVRYRTDGNLDFLGRIDEQVKVRGFRVELGEIESALRRHQGVGDAAVVVREDVPGERRLVAYLVPDKGYTVADRAGTAELLQAAVPAGQGPVVTVQSLRRHLASTLPEYMLPSAWVALAALPLTPNGKLDRRGLPAPGPLQPSSSPASPRASLPVRDLVTAIWSEVLGIEGIAELTGDFFALGGHSLLAMKLFARFHRAFGAHLPIHLVFEAPSLGELAERIEEELRQERDPGRPPLANIERPSPLPLSFAQQRLWYLDQLDPGHAAYNVSVALRVQGRLDVSVLAASIDEIARRHEILRTTFGVVDGVPVQVIHEPGERRLPLVDLSDIPEAVLGRTVDWLVAEDRNIGFDLSRGPLLRLTVLSLGETSCVLLLSAHHIVCDGWSAGVFVRELAAIYSAFVERRPAPLPALACQYADYAVWQRGWLAGPVLDEQLRYWREKLHPLPDRLSLPWERKQQGSPRDRAESRDVALGAELTAGLRKFGNEQGCSLFILLTAAFQAFLSSLSGQTEFIVGTNVGNRGMAEIEPMIGFFVNQVPLRADLALDPSFTELLHDVRGAILGAWAHQDVPFEMLVEAVRPERGPEGAQLFQAKIDFDAVPDDVEIPGIRFQVIPQSSRLAHVDLLMVVEEQPGQLVVSLDYRLDLFTSATIERWLRRFESLLRRVMADPQIRLSTLTAALGDAEREELASRQSTLAESSLQKLRSLRGRMPRT